MGTRRRIRSESPPAHTASNTPAQEDEADVLAEVGAERDEDTGELVASEDAVRAIGAVDAESVRENRRLDAIVDKKRSNQSKVSFNTGDLLTTYETLLRYWPANTLDIHVRRLTGTPVQQVIISRPRSAAELYDALKIIHGQHGEADYEVKILDTNSKQFRGNGKITLPDTRPQQGQPMSYPYPPGYPPQYPLPGYPAQPGYSPPQPQPAYPPAAATAPSPQPPQVPVVVQAPAGPDMGTMFEWFQRMQQIVQSMQPPPQAPPPPPPPPPMPPPGADMPTMMEWFQRMLTLAQSMQPQQVTQGAPPTPPAVPSFVPGMMGAPPIPAPQGTVWTPLGFVPIDRLASLFVPNMGPGSGARMGPQRQYYPQGDPGQAPPPPPRYSSEQPPRQQTAAEHLKESLTLVRTAVATAKEFGSILGTDEEREAPEPVATEEDDSPIKILDTGNGKIAYSKADGTMRWGESAAANLGSFLKWLGEQREAIQKSQNRAPEQKRVLPPGYLEVPPDYQPPPGFVAAAVDPHQLPPTAAPLPPPPANLPPPISPSPASRQTWAPPNISGQGNS